MTATRALMARAVVAGLIIGSTLAGAGPGAVGPVAAAPAPGTITTWAGGVGEGPALNVSVSPVELAVRGALVYFADPTHEAVRVLDTGTREIRTVAGNGDTGVNAYQSPRGDGGPATASRIGRASGVAVDGTGRVYVGDHDDSRVRRVDQQGVISTFAAGVSPEALAMEAQGNLFVASNGAVIRITPAGTASTVVGANCPCGDQNWDLDGTPAVDASVEAYHGMALDPAGRLHVAIRDRVYKVDDAGVLRRVAGGAGPDDLRGDGGPATSARLLEPQGLAFDAAGALYIADRLDRRIRRVSPTGLIITFAGGGTPADGVGDGGPASAAALQSPSGMAAGPEGALYLSDGDHLRKVAGGVITTVAGIGRESVGGDGGPAVNAQLQQPVSLARDASGNTYVADYLANRVRRIDAAGTISTFAGSGPASAFGPGPTFSGDGGRATSARLGGPIGVAADTAGNVFILEIAARRVRKVDPAGIITTVVGGGSDPLGDGEPATAASLGKPVAFAVDDAGNVYVADESTGRVRKVTPGGTISTVAGGGTDPGDGIPATQARLWPYSGMWLAVDPLGQIHIVDGARIRKVDLAGIITTVVTLAHPAGMAFDANGDLYAIEEGSHQVVRVDPLGKVHPVAGSTKGLTAGLGDGGPALDARLDFAGLYLTGGLVLDGAGNLYITDTYNRRVRRVAGAFSPRHVFATGWNALGQLGDGSTSDRLRPAPIGVENARSVAAGVYHSLAVRADGTVWSWGWNGLGQLGDGTTVDRHAPIRVRGLDRVVAVSAGAYNSLALRADGTVWAWGWNGVGQLGDGTTTDRSTPVRVSGLAGVTQISGGGLHSLALTRDGAVWSWGWNRLGQLGTGSASELETRPARVPSSTGATRIAAGLLHSLANGLAGGDGAVYAWGWNGAGQLGDGTTTDRRTPVRLTDDLGLVSAGGHHSFSGDKAWGWNALAQLGVASTAEVVLRPTTMTAPQGIIAAGLAHNVAVDDRGAVWTWGWNRYGALGDGTLTTRAQPAMLPGITAVAAASGGLHSLIVG